MLEILRITTPIYLIIGIGFLWTRRGVFAKAEMRVIGKFVLQLALPALLFRSLAQRQFGEIFNFSYLLSYACGCLLALLAGYQYARRLAGQGPTTSAVYAMGMCSSNSGFVGYPILLLTLAPVAGGVLALNMIVENLLVIPLLLVLAERGQGSPSAWRAFGQSLLRMAQTPLFIAMFLGLGVSLSGWQLPAPLAQTVNMFALASGALSLFVIGGALVGLPMEGMVGRVVPIVLGKLLLHPALVFLCMLALPWVGAPDLAPPLRTAGVLMAAMPMMGIYPTLAQAYGQEDFTAAALLGATVVSFFTLSTLLWVLHL